MLILRSIPSRHSSHRWQHGWIEACAVDKAEAADVSKPQREAGSLVTNKCNRVNNTGYGFHSCIGAASSNSMQRYETRGQRCLLIPAHFIFHFLGFEFAIYDVWFQQQQLRHGEGGPPAPRAGHAGLQRGYRGERDGDAEQRGS